MDNHQPPHILIVAYPIQSHINPALQFATRLTRSGFLATLATTVSAANRMIKTTPTTPSGLSFATFSDGHDNHLFKPSKTNQSSDAHSYLSSLKLHGSETLSTLISTTTTPPFTAIVYTLTLTWVADVAHQHRLPSSLLWIQSATLFSICFHYFNRFSSIIDECDETNPEWRVKLPSLPSLKAIDIPSFLPSSTPILAVRELLKAQFEMFERNETRSVVLVNTFDNLEHEIIGSFDSNPKIKILPVGPLLPTSPSDFKIEMFEQSKTDDYMTWLDDQHDDSVVYVSFGSVSELPRAQIEELAGALVGLKRPFLWAIRNREDVVRLSMWEEAKEIGKVVTWCSQGEVLKHRAVGCFVSHCGWNSTLESLAAGVGVVGVPIGSDQLTNAKMVEEVWEVGVRVEGGVGEGRVVGREEIGRRVEEVMGSEDLGRTVRRWRELVAGANEANVGAFLDVGINFD